MKVNLSTSMCRICMSDKPCHPVLSKANSKMADDVYTYYRIRVTDTDEKSKIICEKCMKPIQKMRNMREVAKKTQTELHFKIMENYGDDVKLENYGFKFKKIIKPLVKHEPPNMKVSKIEKPNSVVPKVELTSLMETIIKSEVENLTYKNNCGTSSDPKYIHLHSNVTGFYKKGNQESELKTVVPKKEFSPLKEGEKVKFTVKSEGGNLTCQYKCGTSFDSLKAYIEHIRKVHQHNMELKDKELQFCPLCDSDYDRDIFFKHCGNCTNRMKISSMSSIGFKCVMCLVIFPEMTCTDFRQHFLFCRSFMRIDTNGKLNYKCLNCTFESNDPKLCSIHAISTCLYLRLNLNYNTRKSDNSPGLIELSKPYKISQSKASAVQ